MAIKIKTEYLENKLIILASSKLYSQYKNASKNIG